jgi:hypothetical protein
MRVSQLIQELAGSYLVPWGRSCSVFQSSQSRYDQAGPSIPVIALSVMQLIVSRDDRKNWARAIALMRHGFGGHPFGADESIARERREGREGPFPKKEASRG